MSDVIYFAWPVPVIESTTVLYDRHAVGHIIPGDPTLVRTRWWNRPLIRLLAPMKVAVFEARPVDRRRGYRIGISRHGSEPRITRKARQDPRFAILLWHESVLVFITNPAGTEEGELAFVERQSLASAKADGIYIAPV